jgi:hypothetical protein
MRFRLSMFIASVSCVMGPAFAQVPNITPEDKLTNCVTRYVDRYSVICERADILARGVAYACAPKREAAHEAAYAKALVRLLDLRSKGSIECQPKSSTTP